MHLFFPLVAKTTTLLSWPFNEMRIRTGERGFPIPHLSEQHLTTLLSVFWALSSRHAFLCTYSFTWLKKTITLSSWVFNEMRIQTGGREDPFYILKHLYYRLFPLSFTYIVGQVGINPYHPIFFIRWQPFFKEFLSKKQLKTNFNQKWFALRNIFIWIKCKSKTWVSWKCFILC